MGSATPEAMVEQAFPMGIDEPAMNGNAERRLAGLALRLDLLLAALRLTRP
ncbi:MAG: hypothetical protein OEU92_13975 [Alphaproteobacteria bacterium]|nr:hypothetical protein [Alphaproteobacteria bacterium]